MPERVPEPSHAFAQEVLRRVNDGRSGSLHRLERTIGIVHDELKHDRRASERHRCVAVEGADLFSDGEAIVTEGEIGVADVSRGAVLVARDHPSAERAHVEVDGLRCAANDEQRNELRLTMVHAPNIAVRARRGELLSSIASRP